MVVGYQHFWKHPYADEADNSVNHSVIICCVFFFENEELAMYRRVGY